MGRRYLPSPPTLIHCLSRWSNRLLHREYSDLSKRKNNHFLDGHIYRKKKNTVGKASDYTQCTLPLINTCEKS
ncbi:hypothetical protein ES332_D02G165300v1 [Gossypium tomentosum]|uniref:Uncharacterized protein n=1 Tax=Gossypium tomentosum TaxID=34277 RepID=A0A5D2LXZ5_GOSTO|nr:hypothetical protein ES332_D02G165300v1 [Gossypium tomentosum]